MVIDNGMAKFMIAGALLLIAFVALKHLLLFSRFKKEKEKAEFSGDFYQYRLEKLIKTRPEQKPKFYSHYEKTWSEVFIQLSFFVIGLFVIIRFVVG